MMNEKNSTTKLYLRSQMTKIILNEKPPESHIDGQASYEKVSRKVRIHVQQLVVGDFEILRRRELCYSTSDLIHLLPSQVVQQSS